MMKYYLCFVGFCNNKHTGTYPNQNDCTRYWICANGKTFPAQCPPGLVYNWRIYSCDERKSVPMVVEDYFFATCGSKRQNIHHFVTSSTSQLSGATVL